MTAAPAPLVVVTSGEPAGIGPDLCLLLAEREWPARLVFLADPTLLADRARQLGLHSSLTVVTPTGVGPHQPRQLQILPVPLAAPCTAGHLDVRNASYVLELLRIAASGCLDGTFAAMVTAPLQKSVINDAGVPFRGHTEFLAALAGIPRPVMLLVADTLRVALATTHVPLQAVAGAIRTTDLVDTLRVLSHGLRAQLGIPSPRIAVLGLNPHAGESGHLGREELDIITPAILRAQAEGLRVHGPLPADTAFTPHHLKDADAVLAMYHDQGLPVLKYAGFGRAVNITLGLPFIRTSVDHGTALDLAGTGQADPSSLMAAVELALRCIRT